MKSNTRLDSIIFQLTPTRTRCDLVITANGKSEKIASGLLNPFLAHLKAAEEQIGKGGYSIVLEPKNRSDAAWFTKGTVERFVRFVSSPEILERVCTIESEILQIEKSISLQNSKDNGLHNQAEHSPVKSEERLEGSKPVLSDGNEEKAIVLYQQPSSHQSEEDASITQEKNSKAQLVEVFETRKSVLQKEQGMAFARAVAAGFETDNIGALLVFAESFGASRMMDACKKFLDLWKAKHESGQWVEVEATEAMSYRSDMPSTNAAGIVFLGPNEQGEIASEMKGTCANSPDPAQANAHAYSPGQFPHPMFPPWQMHPQVNGAPVFPPYAMQGMPYYPNYMGQSPVFHSPYSPHDDSRSHSRRKTRRRRQSMDSRDMSTEFESQEDDIADDEEDSVSRKQKNKGGKSKRQQGTVVIRNINYITSKKQGSSDSDPQSCSDPGTDDEKDGEAKILKHKGVKADDPLIASAKDKRMSGQTGDDGHWQAFQNFLLNDADESNNSARSSEGKIHGRKRQSGIRDDSSALGMYKVGENHDIDMGENLDVSGDATCARKPMDDQMLIYGQDANLKYNNSKKDLQLMEAGGRRGVYNGPVDPSMENVINRQDKLTDVWDPSLDPIVRNGLQGTSNTNHKGLSHGMPDESYMVLQRPGSSDQVTGDGRKTMDIDCELQSDLRKIRDQPVGPRSQTNYEPNVLNIMPNREMENSRSGYDPAMDCEMQAQIRDTTKLSSKKKEVAVDAKGGPKKTTKDQKLKAERRTSVGARREKPSKLSPAEDARARAEKLRAYKADLQKQKKEKEEEQMKRIEALKLERQKRIAAKSGVNPAQSTLPSQPAKRQMPKLSPSQKSSKFSDTEPGSCSPLQRSKLRIISKVSPDSSKAKPVNRLTRSASSLRSRKEEKVGATPDTKATISRIRRLSEPKSTSHNFFSGKTGTSEVVSRRVSEKPEIKKTSATTNLDRAKSSALPDVKVRVSKASSVTAQRKSTKEISLNNNEKKPANNLANASVSKDNDYNSPSSNVDDNTVVEKAVVILEREKPSAPVFHAPKDSIDVQTMDSHAYNQASKPAEDLTVPPPASPIIVREVDREAPNSAVKEKSQTHLDETDKVSSNVHSVESQKKPYQAPYARVSSTEDPCMAESDYGKAPPVRVEAETTGSQTTKVHVPDTHLPRLVDTSEADSGKNQGKESSKGIKRLLMFGKKNSAAGERSNESDKVHFDGSIASEKALNGSSSEVFTVKNLLSHEESSSAGSTPKKSSRPFSLLSHFRSKTSEKKLAT